MDVRGKGPTAGTSEDSSWEFFIDTSLVHEIHDNIGISEGLLAGMPMSLCVKNVAVPTTHCENTKTLQRSNVTFQAKRLIAPQDPEQQRGGFLPDQSNQLRLRALQAEGVYWASRSSSAAIPDHSTASPTALPAALALAHLVSSLCLAVTAQRQEKRKTRLMCPPNPSGTWFLFLILSLYGPAHRIVHAVTPLSPVAQVLPLFLIPKCSDSCSCTHLLSIH